MLILMIYLIDGTQGGYTALHYAVDNCHLDCSQLLVQAGAVIDMQSSVSTHDVYTVYDHVNSHDIPYR